MENLFMLIGGGVLIAAAAAAIIVAIIKYKHSDNNKYHLDFGGNDLGFKGVRKFYHAGNSVKIYYTMAATDTDYTFIVDGKTVPALYEDGKGFVLTFRMPPADAKVTVIERNTMLPDRQTAEDITERKKQ